MMMTPTALAAHERRKRFRADIAAKAMELANGPRCAPASNERGFEVNVFPTVYPNYAASYADTYPKIVDIQRSVCLFYSEPFIDLIGQRRTENIVLPRMIAMYLARKLTTQSLPVIGRAFGGRDHTTVIHGVKKIEHLLRQDTTIEFDIIEIKKILAKTEIGVTA